MNRSPVTPGLDPGVADVLGGRDLPAAVGLTLSLASVDDGGYPHGALLSCGEVLHLGGDVLGVATWQGTRTTTNLLARGQALLSLVLGGEHCALRLDVADAGPLEVGGRQPLQSFRCTVVSTERQSVDYARLVSGITFEVLDPDAVLARWGATVTALRTLAPAATGTSGS